jgi:hypothetical protein
MHAHGLLAFDEFAVEELDEGFARARVELVAPKFHEPYVGLASALRGDCTVLLSGAHAFLPVQTGRLSCLKQATCPVLSSQ